MSVVVSAWFCSPGKDLEVPAAVAPKLRRSDDFIRYGVSGVYEIVRNCGTLSGEQELAESDVLSDCGLIVATGFGTMQTNFDVLESVVFGQQTSPTLFSHSVFNSGAGYLSSIFSIDGPSLTLTDFAFPFFRGLQQGISGLEAGRVSRCLVLQIETYSELLHQGRREGLDGVAPCEWQPGLVCWLLQTDDGEGCCRDNCFRLDNLELLDKPLPSGNYLEFEEILAVKRLDSKIRDVKINDPLGAAMEITRMVGEGIESDKLIFSLTADWGDVRFNTEKL